MSSFYEVWDYETRNQINCFETEAAARAFLSRQLELNGLDGVRHLAIVRQDPDGSGEYEPTLILEGIELLRTVGGTDGRSVKVKVHHRRIKAPTRPEIGRQAEARSSSDVDDRVDSDG